MGACVLRWATAWVSGCPLLTWSRGSCHPPGASGTGSLWCPGNRRALWKPEAKEAAWATGPGRKRGEMGARVSQGPEVTGAHREPHRTARICQWSDRSALESMVKVSVASLYLPPEECLSPILAPWAWGRGCRVSGEVRVPLKWILLACPPLLCLILECLAIVKIFPNTDISSWLNRVGDEH